MLTRQNKSDRDAEFCKAMEYSDFFTDEQIIVSPLLFRLKLSTTTEPAIQSPSGNYMKRTFASYHPFVTKLQVDNISGYNAAP